MIKIPKEKWRKLVQKNKDYISKAIIRHEYNGKVCNVGDWCGFESAITGDSSKGTTLIFEHIHFEIV